MPVGAKPTQQKRSEEKRDRIVDALDELLQRVPFEQIAIADIAAQAGVAPATIYQRFNNRDAAVAILIELYQRRVQDWAGDPQRRPRLSPTASLPEALLEIARNGWRQVRELGYVMRPAYLYSRLRPDLLGPTWLRLERLAVSGFRALLEQHRGAIKRADLDEVAATLTAFYNLMLLGPLLHNEESWPFLRNENDFAQRLTELALPYLANAAADLPAP